MQSTTAFRSLLLTLAALSFAACGSDSTDPAGGGGGGGGGEVPEFPEIPPAAQIFTDDIDSENGGIGEANYEGWANWTVTEGCVDLHVPQSTDPLAALGIGVYMDLDGSCLEAGTMETKTTFDFEVGDYTLEFLIAGNSQLGPQLDTLDVAVGGALSERIVLDWQDPLALMSFDFTVGAATSGKIRLEHHGGDEQGILIDAIRLRRN